MKNEKYCILFAGAVGSSKTPIATYLSCSLNLPIFNNDALRSEVIEDIGKFDPDEYSRRQVVRLMTMLRKGLPFIADASIDREWTQAKKELDKAGYRTYIISLDLSKDKLAELYRAKGYQESLNRIDELVSDHENFLDHFSEDVDFRIDDQTFVDRLELCRNAVQSWLAGLDDQNSITPSKTVV